MVNTPSFPTVAYFSMEAGLESAMPTYSGGLGVLAGDTLRATADVGVPVVGISLLYRQGFFRQQLDVSGNQTEVSYTWEPLDFLKPLPTKVRIPISGREVVVGAWRYDVRGMSGHVVPVYLLDTDHPENDPADRLLTGQLYGGDVRYRLRQEVILGMGGVAMLRALGHNDIQVFHMNEGHCALLTLALLGEQLDGPYSSATNEDIEAVRQQAVFTTHTPVPAGHDRFSTDLVREVLGDDLADLIGSLPFFADGFLNMTHLALFFSRFANAVARRHAQVAREMYPGDRIFSITNGVHAPTWTAPPLADLYDREMPQWRYDGHYLRQALAIPVDDLQEAHLLAKRALFQEVKRRTGVQLDLAVLTIGFARRAATYKRADLVFRDIDKLAAMAEDGWPIQFVYAGKAHPHDDPAKSLIRSVYAASERLRGKIPVVYLEEHDMALGKLLCSGVDLWLNNPQKPQEASGTSGMKAALNGVPSLSILDGWWPEGWLEGVTGWSIDDRISDEPDAQSEAQAIYSKLRYLIAPLYYGSPNGYARVMRSTVAINGSYFTAQRMVEQYVENAYRARVEGRV